MFNWLVICTFLSAFLTCCNSATPSLTTPEAPQITKPDASTPSECVPELLPPKLTHTEPEKIVPGEQFKLVGQGGYIRDSCGGFNESARTFDVYLDDQPIGSMVCYVNHCEGTLSLPSNIQPGTYCLSPEPEKCHLEIVVSRR